MREKIIEFTEKAKDKLDFYIKESKKNIYECIEIINKMKDDENKDIDNFDEDRDEDELFFYFDDFSDEDIDSIDNSIEAKLTKNNSQKEKNIINEGKDYMATIKQKHKELKNKN